MRAVLRHFCCSETGSVGVIEHPRAKHPPSACFHSCPIHPKKVSKQHQRLHQCALVAPSALFCDSPSSCSISGFSCLLVSFLSKVRFEHNLLVLHPWCWSEVSGLWFPPGDRHVLAAASGLTTTPRRLIRGHLG